MTSFSVVIATRNRPIQFAHALRSVLDQSAPPAEIIVVNDGSDKGHSDGYRRALSEAGERLRVHELVSRPNGHGPSYALNFGVFQASGDYIAFLDDDDTWTDTGHLERAAKTIDSSDDVLDLYMTNQVAYLNDAMKPGPIWIEDLERFVREEGRERDQCGTYAVSVADLLRCSGFCHLNTLIVRRSLYDQIGGMDEAQRWECDRDLYLRLIDRASAIRYAPVAIARHNIPDPAKKANVTTGLSELERRLFQIRVLDRAILFADDARIRAYARRHKGYALKKIAETVAATDRRKEAAFYAREALGASPTLKWTVYTAWQMLRAVGKRVER